MNPTLKKQQPNPYSQNLKKEQDELVLQYLPAVRAMAYRLRERLPASVDVNDLISIGTEEMIIQLYYFEELNLKEISEVLDISESRISQIYKKLLAKIKEQLGINHG